MGDRRFARQVPLYSGSEDIEGDWPLPEFPVAENLANLVTSAVEQHPWDDFGEDLHMPAIDIDFPARLVPSSTEGHFHLFLDKEITWEQYVMLLAGLRAANLIQPTWFTESLRRGYTALRHNTTKQQEAEERRG